MAGSADAAKNLFDSVFSKTKEVVAQASETTKGLASQAFENVQKIIPGQNSNAAAADPAAAAPGTVPTVPPTAPQ
ncbi:hypothetical protein M3Y97_00049500 [Aphelenchoides bicaudatus]|nr:hypothetical protein M3Y97_00049500 [Aphelenchoides bicaudatus]